MAINNRVVCDSCQTELYTDDGDSSDCIEGIGVGEIRILRARCEYDGEIVLPRFDFCDDNCFYVWLESKLAEYKPERVKDEEMKFYEWCKSTKEYMAKGEEDV